jgi:hypothetical protein
MGDTETGDQVEIDPQTRVYYIREEFGLDKVRMAGRTGTDRQGARRSVGWDSLQPKHVRAGDAGPGVRLLAISRGRSPQVAFYICESGTSATRADVGATRANRQVTKPNRPHFLKLRRIGPDFEKLLVADISSGQRKLDARVDFSIRRNVARAVAGTARKLVEDFLADRRGWCAIFSDIAYERLVVHHCAQIATRDVEVQERPVAVDVRRDRRIDGETSAKISGKGLDSGIIHRVLAHQDVGERDLQILRNQELDGRDRPSFSGLRAISILWRALASVRTSKKFCVGVRSPLLDDGPTVPPVAS